MLCLTHTDSGLIAATVVEHKGSKDAFGAGTAARFIEDLGEKTIALRTDQEPAIRALAARVKKEASCNVILQPGPTLLTPVNGSHREC